LKLAFIYGSSIRIYFNYIYNYILFGSKMFINFSARLKFAFYYLIPPKKYWILCLG